MRYLRGRNNGAPQEDPILALAKAVGDAVVDVSDLFPASMTH